MGGPERISYTFGKLERSYRGELLGLRHFVRSLGAAHFQVLGYRDAIVDYGGDSPPRQVGCFEIKRKRLIVHVNPGEERIKNFIEEYELPSLPTPDFSPHSETCQVVRNSID